MISEDIISEMKKKIVVISSRLIFYLENKGDVIMNI